MPVCCSLPCLSASLDICAGETRAWWCWNRGRWKGAAWSVVLPGQKLHLAQSQAFQLRPSDPTDRVWSHQAAATFKSYFSCSECEILPV